MSEPSDNVKKLLGVLSRHADIVAEAFDGQVSMGDKAHQKGVEALFEVGAIKPYDEGAYRLNPRLREFLADHLSSYHALKDLRNLSASMRQAMAIWDEMRHFVDNTSSSTMDQLYWALDEVTVDIAYSIEQNLHMLHVLIGNKYGNVESLQSKLRQNARYLRQIKTFLSSMSSITQFSQSVNEQAIARGLPEARMLVSRRLGSQVLKWSGLIKDAQSVISTRLFDARLMDRRQKLLSGVALWLGRHKTTAGWDIEVDPAHPLAASMLRPAAIAIRVQPDVADTDDLINADLLSRVLPLLPPPKLPKGPKKPSSPQALIEDEDEDEDEEEQIPSHVRAIMALASELRGSEEKVSLLEWKRGRMDLSEVDDSAWLMYCYPRLASLGLNAQMVDSKPTQLFSVNELFDDVLVFSAEKVQG